MFIGFLEYVISQIQLKPGYIPGDYVGSNELFDGEGHDGWRNFQVSWSVKAKGNFLLRHGFVLVLWFKK